MSRIPIDRYGALFKEKDTDSFNQFDYIHRFTSPLLALLFAELFWPNFIEVENMVFLRSEFEDKDDLDRLHQAIEKYDSDKRKVEESFNTIEVPSLFGARMDDTTDEEDLILAKTIASMWKSRLTGMFPTRKFTVKVLGPDETGGEIAVLFYQK